ncbi:glutamine amidotransferase [Homoserinibacter sp. GY 40078]|uniref:glutamine amidotransferase n=1 Tax=Homoserinibacter sp. GY 40078 TaxID=2603275 RepID=UPI0011CA73A7|nr:glutamine amidotransferase [Homoserinibacter sp. GY 40078]TXK18744.1 glutamine amidotransferase [Homoserinibacter sp. GY 40078]
MCGIAALQIKDPALRDRLGDLLHGMLCEVVDRGPDSAGISVYDDETLTASGSATVSLLGVTVTPDELHAATAAELPAGTELTVRGMGDTTLVNADVPVADLVHALRKAAPDARQIGRGTHVATLKGVGNPVELADEFGLVSRSGTQGVSHTRMATESAVTASGSHPFTVDDDLCLVHNGSFSNHATIRRTLRAQGVEFDSDNDSEVAARYLAVRLRAGDDLETALEHLKEEFDGFYTLVVTTKDGLAVVRDPIACKPAVIAETDQWVAMASEYRALAGLPGIENARLFEPAPGKVYTWAL